MNPRIALRFAAAGEVAALLSDLVAHASRGGVPGVRVQPDERTNSLLVAGSAADLLRARGLAARLDVEQSADG